MTLNQWGESMEELRPGTMEFRFAELIWERAPVPSGELVPLCEKAFGWKKSTTYTMLRRLCERGIFANEDGAVTVRQTREEFLSCQSERYVEESFGGSLPRFLTAFCARKKLSEKDIEELRALIDAQRR